MPSVVVVSVGLVRWLAGHHHCLSIGLVRWLAACCSCSSVGLVRWLAICWAGKMAMLSLLFGWLLGAVKGSSLVDVRVVMGSSHVNGATLAQT